jgi:hypothetical protein
MPNGNSPFSNPQQSIFNGSKFKNFLKMDIVLICAILSTITLSSCFALIFIDGLSCDTSGYTSPIITFIMTSWLSKLYSFLSTNGNNGSGAPTPEHRQSGENIEIVMR